MYIPWGDIDWVLERLGRQNWHLVGCVAHEARCFSTLRRVPELAGNARFVRIFDDDPSSPALELKSLDAQIQEGERIGLRQQRVVDADLLASVDEIENFVATLSDETDSVILDISCFPKRWFFVLLRLLLEDKRLSNIVVTYSLGKKYGDQLSSNPDIARTLPTFMSKTTRNDCDVAILSIGYDTNTIIDLLKIERPRSIRVLFPFPPGPPGIRRNWMFLDSLERTVKDDQTVASNIGGRFDYVQVAATDVPGNFSALRKATVDAGKSSLLAPYGPKPVSLAMCLFSLAAEKTKKEEVPVYYSQPMRYALDYTQGVFDIDGTPTVYAYPIRVSGQEFYRFG